MICRTILHLFLFWQTITHALLDILKQYHQRPHSSCLYINGFSFIFKVTDPLALFVYWLPTELLSLE